MLGLPLSSGNTVPANSSISFSAQTGPCTTPQYAWWIGVGSGAGAQWSQPVVPYGPASTYTFNTSTVGPGTYTVTFWAENQGGPSGSFDNQPNPYFVVTVAPAATPTPSPTPAPLRTPADPSCSYTVTSGPSPTLGSFNCP